MLASAMGVLLAVTLLSVAVVHSHTLAEAGLGYTMAISFQEFQSLELVVQDRPTARADYGRLRSGVEEVVQDRLGWLSQETHRSGRAQSLPAAADATGLRLSPENSDAYLFFRSEFQEHTRLVAGRWPNGVAGTAEDGSLSLEAALGAPAADSLGWSPGAAVTLFPFGTDSAERVTIRVVGIVEPKNPKEIYWLSNLSAFRIMAEDDQVLVPIYVPEEGFFSGLGAQYPMLLSTYRWYVFLDAASLRSNTAVQVREDLETLEADLSRLFPRSLAFSSLGHAVETYQRRLSLARVPLFLFASLVVAAVLYYLVLVTGMLVRSRGPEAAVLGSRGGTQLQVGALLGLGEGLAVVLPAVAVGPFLGWAVARTLPVGDSGMGDATTGLSLSVFLVATAVGVACLGIFLLAGLGVARQGIVQFLRQRTRPLESPALYRYALDLLLLALVALLWWQVRGRGGFLTRRLLGDELDIDPSLLLGPALFLLAVGLGLLRLLPYLLRLLVRLVEPLGWAWLAHGLRRMARDPLPYSTLGVLLMLATALGLFGAMFGATLTQSQEDQARYVVGGEVLIGTQGFRSGPEQQQQELLAVPGVQRVAPVHRGTLGTGSRFSGGTLSLLAVDPEELSQVAWFRDDFAEESLQELLRPLGLPGSPQQGILLPEGADRLGVWALPERPYPYNLWARLRDSHGQYGNVFLGSLQVSTWSYMEGPLPTNRVAPPFTLVSLNISGAPFSGYGQGSLALDAVTATVGGEQTVVEEFESGRPWMPLPNLGLQRDTLAYEREMARSGDAGALLSWEEPISGESRGLMLPPVPMPIRAIGSDAFTPGQEVVGEMGGQPINLVVWDTVQYFPTLYPDDRPFLLVGLEHMKEYMRSLPLAQPLQPTELWVGLFSGADRPQTLAAIRETVPLFSTVRDREAEAQRAQNDPLAGGAWDGLALLGLGALAGITVLGFALYAVLAVQRGRLELGLLRALGLSRWQVGLVLSLEGLLITALALAVGGAAGVWAGRWTLGNLGITPEGLPVVPPMALVLDGRLASLTYLVVALAAGLATLLAVALAARLRVHEVLRVEE